MNKKFSTLVASLLLAGALGSPVWAGNVGTVTGWTTGTELVAAQNADISGVYLMSEAIGGANKILAIRNGNLALINATEALPSDKVDYVKVSSGTFKLKKGDKYLKVTTDAGVAAFNEIEANATVFTVKAAGTGNVVSITWVAPVTTANTCYFQGSDGSLLSNVTTVGLASGAASIQFAANTVTNIAEVSPLPAGYAELLDENFVSADVWRSFVTSATNAVKIDGTGLSSVALATSSKITIESAGADKYYLLIGGKKAYVAGSTVKVDDSGSSTTFSLVDLEDGQDNSNRYLVFTDADGQLRIVTSTSGTIGASAYDGQGGLVANALPFKVSEIAAPVAFADPAGYESVAFADVAEGTYYLATSASNFVNAGFTSSSTTPVAWTLTKSGTGYILTSTSGTLSVSSTSISVGTTGSSTALKVVEGENGNLYLTTVDNKVVKADYSVAAAATETGDRPLSPLAIKLCKVKVEAPDMTEAQPNEEVTDLAKEAVGKYNYITYGKNFLKDKAGAATTDVKAAAMWKVSKVSEGAYSIADADGNKVAFDATGNFDSKNGKYATFNYVDGKLSFTTTAGTYYISSNGSVWSAETTAPDSKVVFYVSTLSAGNIAEQVDYLNGQLGNGFEVVFKEKNASGKLVTMTVQDNPFVNGIMTAVAGPKAIGGNDHETSPVDLSDKMFLKIAGSYPLTKKGATVAEQLAAFRSSTFIVVSATRYSAKITDETSNNFFEYTTVKGSSLISQWGSVVASSAIGNGYAKDDYKEGHKLFGVNTPVDNAAFQVSSYANDSYGDPMYLSNAQVYAPKDGVKDPTFADYESVGELKVSVKTYLKKNYVGAYDGDAYDMVYFGSTNQVKQKDIVGIVNIISRNYKTSGKVYANGDANDEIVKLAAERVVLHNPEGQFYVTATSDDLFTFTNRESGRIAFEDVVLSKVPGKDDVYAVGNTEKDTILVAEATVGNMYDGYANYDVQSQLENKTYNILAKSGVSGVDNVYLAENHKEDHTIGASADVEDAINWRLIKYTAAGDAEKLHNDTIYTIREKAISYKDGDSYKLKNDTIAMFVYALYNDANSEYLNYADGVNHKAYYCDPEILAGKASADVIRDHAAKFILKEKNDGTYNLIVVEENGRFDHSTDAENYGKFSMSSNIKAYIGVNDAKLNQESSIYKISDNDLFIIQEVDAPKYRSVATFDTIRIYKNDNEKIALYERGQFLGMQHLADVPNMAAAMFVDTAYVSNTNMPQYLLAVQPELIWHDANCNIPGHPAVDPTAVDTVKGRFLVNMIDSLNAWGNKHNNPYEWETYPKLSFKTGYHAANKLVIETAKPTAPAVIDLSANTHKIGTYAFRYVDRSQGSFVIETGTKDAKGNAQTGYIKWLNGTPVVVPNLALAEVFNLEVSSETPTANDEIGTTEVSVIAGNGVVTIKGAEGKKVSISNLLGQTIANTVITSSEAQISAPAGIVVVAVEGEAAVKAIVK